MDLMARRILDLRVLFAFSTTVTAIAGIAILFLGVPPKILVPVAYGIAAIGAFASHWAERRLGER